MQKTVTSVSDGLNGHHNSFGLIRLGLAVLVIVSHSFELGGWGTDPTSRWSGQTHIGTLAVVGFFALSGYMVAKSALRADILQFAWRRALRLMPAFWLCLIVVAFVLGPVVWLMDGKPIADYFTFHHGPVSYLLKNYSAFVTKFGIHDVFQTTTPFGIATDASAVNGSIWTLRHEILAYGILALLAVFGVLRNARPLVPALAVFFIVLQLVESVYPGTAREINDVLGMSKILPLLSAFFIGATMALYSRTIPLTNGLGVGSILVFLFSWWQGGVFLIGVPAFVYALIWIAAALPVWFQRVGNDGRPDLSYGVYLYGWPVQQFLAYLHVYELGYVLYTLLSIAGSLVLAAGSWFLVERPALSLKDRGPGRGIAHWMSRLPRRAGTRSQLPADPR